MTRLAWCVSGMESDHRFHINTGNGYYGGYQFKTTTWQWTQRRMRVHFAPRADLATPAQQTAAFRYLAPRDPSAWPTSLPACTGR